MDKIITLTPAEHYALLEYFNDTTINISSMIKKKGLKTTRDFEAAVNKLYKEENIKDK
jgi:hypothetical protein